MTMKGQFSIEWLSQSSQGLGRQRFSSCLETCNGPSASGTHSESLPGFYSTTRPLNQDHLEGRVPHSLPSHTESERGTNHQSPHFPNNQQVAATGFSSGTEEETSGYESEGGRSLSPSASLDRISPSPSSPPSGRRPRTAFTTDQIRSLERAFKRNAYLGTQDKAELCKKLNLSDKQIRNWFQNRRMKLKRTVQDALAHACQAKVASHLLHYSELQAFCSVPYPSYHPHLVPEGPTTAPYLQPHSMHYNSSPASQTLPGVSTLPLDSRYQYATLPGLMVASSSSPLMGAHRPYLHQY